jgi:RNA polymerase sigma factor (sigma-70 family)
MAEDDHSMVRHDAVRSGLPHLLTRLWRYGLVLSGERDMADELVQATCLRALERAHQFTPGTDLGHWTFKILGSIWSNELRARRVRVGEGIVEAEFELATDGEREIEMNIFVRQVLIEIGRLPEVQRVAVLLVYGEGLSYREAADVLEVPIGTVMSRLAAARATLGSMKQDAPPSNDEDMIDQSKLSGRDDWSE